MDRDLQYLKNAYLYLYRLEKHVSGSRRIVGIAGVLVYWKTNVPRLRPRSALAGCAVFATLHARERILWLI